MKRKLFIGIILLITILGLLCGCGKNNPIGEWVVWSSSAGSSYYHYNIPVPLSDEELEPLTDSTVVHGGESASGSDDAEEPIDVNSFILGEENYQLVVNDDGTYNTHCFDSVCWGTWTQAGDVVIFTDGDGNEVEAYFEKNNFGWHLVFDGLGDGSVKYLLEKR